jgi:hypothetical protein
MKIEIDTDKLDDQEVRLLKNYLLVRSDACRTAGGYEGADELSKLAWRLTCLLQDRNSIKAAAGR